jgi:hypothetical protein
MFINQVRGDEHALACVRLYIAEVVRAMGLEEPDLRIEG